MEFNITYTKIQEKETYSWPLFPHYQDKEAISSCQCSEVRVLSVTPMVEEVDKNLAKKLELPMTAVPAIDVGFYHDVLLDLMRSIT